MKDSDWNELKFAIQIAIATCAKNRGRESFPVVNAASADVIINILQEYYSVESKMKP